MIPTRDPRTDPLPGDVLESEKSLISVIGVRNGLVKVQYVMWLDDYKARVAKMTVKKKARKK